MQDLTKIDKPFGLLDKETQERLKAHGGPYELYCYLGKWVGINVRLSWMPNEVYSAKPAPEPEIIQTTVSPPRRCEAWVNVYADGNRYRFGCTNYANEQNARDEGSADELYIATVRIEYVEGQDND